MNTGRKDILGQRFGRLLVLSYDHTNNEGKAMWRCRCDCGVEKVISGKRMRTGEVQSCGCFGNERRNAALRTASIRHGHASHVARTKVYRAWIGMMSRCSNPNAQSYKHYGGRGISVCERWRVFENFLADMGEPSAGLSLDRYPDQNGNYEPGNCRWATWLEQENNRRNNRWVTWNGQDLTLAQLIRLTGINERTFHARLRRGWSLEQAVTIPVTGSTLTNEWRKQVGLPLVHPVGRRR